MPFSWHMQIKFGLQMQWSLWAGRPLCVHVLCVLSANRASTWTTGSVVHGFQRAFDAVLMLLRGCRY